MTASPQTRLLPAPPVTAHFRVLDYRFGIRSDSALALRLLHRLYPSVVTEASAVSTDTFSLQRRDAEQGRQWEVRVADQSRHIGSSLGNALNSLEYEICLRTIANHPDLIALHGATVLTGGGAAAFISGPSGAGKTTLSLALAARGYRLGGDDVALLDPRSGTIRPVPRCFHLDARSRRLLRNLPLPMPEEALRYAFMTPADLGVTETGAFPVRLIVFLGRGPGRRPQLTALSQAEMIVRLLSESPRGAHSANEIMAALRPLVSAAACCQLLGGRLSDTVDAMVTLLGPP